MIKQQINCQQATLRRLQMIQHQQFSSSHVPSWRLWRQPDEALLAWSQQIQVDELEFFSSAGVL
jgi:hypothetical protein